jgi:hypothetical protein
MEPVITRLLQYGEPAVRFKVLTGALVQDPDDMLVAALRMTVRRSPLAQTLLAHRNEDGRLPYHPYFKWLGAHWTLVQLADLGYPSGDDDLLPLREQVHDWLFSPSHQRNIPVIQGRARRCASQEGNAVLAMLTLGLANERTDELARRLRGWQWPDGGWNCDRAPQAAHSSYHETLIPLRALALHARETGDTASEQCVAQGVEVLLKRQLYLRLSTGEAIDPRFTQLCYPYYWHYNILYALRVMAECGAIDDPRCARALDLLESKRLPDGGWPAETKRYTVYRQGKLRSGHSLVDWGGVKRQQMNPWVTAEALAVLRAAGRLDDV